MGRDENARKYQSLLKSLCGFGELLKTRIGDNSILLELSFSSLNPKIKIVEGSPTCNNHFRTLGVRIGIVIVGHAAEREAREMKKLKGMNKRHDLL
jgi:hypothetical protein